MTITNMGTYLLLESSYISEVIATPLNYIKLEVIGNINCCATGCGQLNTTITFNYPFTTTTNLELNTVGLKVFPAFFGLTSFIDGVYRISVKRFEENVGTIFIENCLFIDVTIKCKVAALLKEIIEENKVKTGEKKSTIAHLLHYALVNGSNCGCNCAEMCDVYKELVALLDTINPEIFTDCGC